MISMNLKEGGRCVVNRDEDLTVVDFDGDVSLAEKEAAVLSTAVKTKVSRRSSVEAIVDCRGVGKVSLFVGADATVVVHEEDDLV
ncbi:hypothetical protein BHE74_00029539 [Ensete ventricosum]|nr:hypothetical protein BHE74_00029539 [Ensete ventricosum]RZR84263.1 hypothetical protein BHM03_00011047 [Ensete ventricosum]